MPLMWLIVLATSIWMAVDSSQLGYDRREIKGLAGMGPGGWLISGLLLWIVAFPMYLVKRPVLKAAGQARRFRAQRGFAALPPSPYGQHAPPPPAVAPVYGAQPSVPANLRGYPQPGTAPGAAPTGYAQASGNPYAAPVPQPPAGYGGGPPQPGVHSPAPGAYGGQPSSPQPSAYWQNQASAPPSGEAPSSVFRVADEIVKLGALRDSGLLTDAEFQLRKAQLLNS